MSTAAVVIIGNEILSGKFADENGPFLIHHLRRRGVSLRRLVVIPDVIPEIAAEVARCAATADHVLTTGGVGPTHDDVTFEAVAAAFAEPLEELPELVGLLRRYELPLDAANLRMARVPRGSELVWSEDRHYPVLRCRNVWMFPGVPKLLRLKFPAMAHRLGGVAMHTARITARDDETRVAAWLAELAAAHTRVEIGSYPRFGEGEGRLMITVEGPGLAEVDAVLVALRAHLDVIAEVRAAEGPS